MNHLLSNSFNILRNVLLRMNGIGGAFLVAALILEFKMDLGVTFVRLILPVLALNVSRIFGSLNFIYFSIFFNLS